MRGAVGAETIEAVSAPPPAHCIDTTDWHPQLVRLYRYWVELSRQDGGGIPLRRSFDAAAVPDLLPQIWMLDIQYEPTYRLRYRLLGTRIERQLGRQLRGRWIDESTPAIANSDYLARYQSVSLTGIPSRRKGVPTFWQDKVAAIENVVLPFTELGGRASCLMVHTRFYRSDGKEF